MEEIVPWKIVLALVIGALTIHDVWNWIRGGCPVPKHMHAVAALACFGGAVLAWIGIARGEAVIENVWIPFAAPGVAYVVYGAVGGEYELRRRRDPPNPYRFK